jgi:CubicO group peptidase (beta-lactamase class C family)
MGDGAVNPGFGWVPWFQIRPRVVLIILFISAARTATAWGQQQAPVPTQASPLTLENYAPFLEETYPTVRAVVVSRGDCAIFEYHRKDIGADTRSPVYSVTKSMLSILVGIAIDKGYLRLDEKLSEVAPDAFDDKVDQRARDITIRDLLTKTEGFAESGEFTTKVSYPDADLWRWMLNRPVKYTPGTHFRYDEIGADLLSVVLSRAIKQNAERFAQENLFNPLHIDNYDWLSDAEGHLFGESHLKLTARDMAKIGALYLQHGRWGNEQIVSEAFVAESTTKQIDGGPPVNAGYGYLWWIDSTKTNLAAFFAAGAGSQAIYVVPKLNVVVALQADKIRGGSQQFINDVILPAEALLSPSAPCVARLARTDAPSRALRHPQN